MRYPRGLMLGVALLAKLVGCSVYPISINREKQGIKNIRNKIWLKKLLKFATYIDLKFLTWKKINRNINDENILIVDRFLVDNLVDYFLATEEFSDIEKLTRKFLPLIPKKSKIIFLDIEPVTSFKRKKEERVEILEKRKNVYDKITNLLKIKKINANKTIEDVHLEIIKEIEK